MDIMNIMNCPIKIVFFALCLFLLSGCFPSFSPIEKEQKSIEVDNGKIVLINYLGIIDQRFPDCIYFINQSDSVLLYKGYSVNDIKMNNDTLIIVSGDSLYSCKRINRYIKIVFEHN